MALLLLGATCGTMASAEKERKTATAGIKDGKGQNAGQAKFTATKGGVEMSVTVTPELCTALVFRAPVSLG